MSSQQKYALAVLVLVAVIVYLFVTAPTELPEDRANTQTAGTVVPIEVVMRLVAAENDAARALYTGEIVGAGQRAGLAFDEDWRDDDVEAGPLPALFLRETATSIEKNPVPLALFLGSEFPIAASNRFSGAQMAQFELIKSSGEPQFFFDEDTQYYTAMFPDFASVQPCVDCHNAHPDSPKVDWILNDVMGATTWAYPKEAVTVEELLQILRAVRGGFYDAYTAYIEKARNFANPPVIGEQWPRDGYFLPSPEVFADEFERRASPLSIEMIMDAVDQDT